MQRRATSGTRQQTQDTASALFDLFWELALSYFPLNAAGHRIAADSGLSPGKISLLRSLSADGPQSVAQLARSRPVARQGVQLMADQLVAAGLAEFIDNPTHRRAKLVRVTAEGSRALASMLAAQLAMARSLAPRFGHGELKTSISVLRRLRPLLAAFKPNTTAKQPRERRSRQTM